MSTLTAVVSCSSCTARLARDNHDTVCSPCRRRSIESRACWGATIARDRARIKDRFDREGLRGVATMLGCTVPAALEVTFDAQLLPPMSARRQAALRQLVTLERMSHVAAGDVLGISRWTVATYRSELGLVQTTGSAARSGRLTGDRRAT